MKEKKQEQFKKKNSARNMKFDAIASPWKKIRSKKEKRKFSCAIVMITFIIYI